MGHLSNRGPSKGSIVSILGIDESLRRDCCRTKLENGYSVIYLSSKGDISNVITTQVEHIPGDLDDVRTEVVEVVESVFEVTVRTAVIDIHINVIGRGRTNRRTVDAKIESPT